MLCSLLGSGTSDLLQLLLCFDGCRALPVDIEQRSPEVGVVPFLSRRGGAALLLQLMSETLLRRLQRALKLTSLLRGVVDVTLQGRSFSSLPGQILLGAAQCRFISLRLLAYLGKRLA